MGKMVSGQKANKKNYGDCAIAGTQQMWTSVVNVVLVEAKNLLPTEMSVNAPLPDPYVKFKLGTEKYKSKVSF